MTETGRDWRNCPPRVSGIFLLTLAAALLGARNVHANGRRLIETGFDSPDSRAYAVGEPDFERLPFAGTVVIPTRLSGGHEISAAEVFSDEHWEAAEFAGMISDFRSVIARRPIEVFLLVQADPGGVDWFDDKAWDQIEQHFRILANIVNVCRLRGFLFDCESYAKPNYPFAYSAIPHASERDFQKYRVRVRQRAQATMAQIAAQAPRATILGYYLLSVIPFNVDLNNNSVLQSVRYGLVPSWVDGWLQAAPRTITFHDENENSYFYSSASQFQAAQLCLRSRFDAVASGGGRVHLGSCIYLDHCRPADAAGVSFDVAIANARQWSDEYILVYGERGTWWKRNHRFTYWPDRFPGIEAALRSAPR